MKKISIVFGLLFLSIGMSCYAQVYRDVYIKAGDNQSNGIPSHPTPPNTVVFQGEVEIVLGPNNSSTVNDEFSTQGYFGNGNGYFHAYLVPPPAFAELKKQLDGSYCETNAKKLNFKYVEKYVEGPLNYQIYDYQRNPLVVKPITINGLILTKKVGDNYFTLDLSLISSFVATNEEATYYTLEVTNEKNEKTLLRFRYSPNE